jgi:hypothetical protein
MSVITPSYDQDKALFKPLGYETPKVLSHALDDQALFQK